MAKCQVEDKGCKQIKTFNLSQNLLSSETIDYVLKQLDEFGTNITFGIANLSKNCPPTVQGKVYQANLEGKGWQIIVDNPTTVNELANSFSFEIYPNPSHEKFHLHVNKLPANGNYNVDKECIELRANGEDDIPFKF